MIKTSAKGNKYSFVEVANAQNKANAHKFLTKIEKPK